jgi:hypothetical protein
MRKHVITVAVVALAMLVGSTASAAGYGRLTDAAGIACIDNVAGGMGITT